VSFCRNCGLILVIGVHCSPVPFSNTFFYGSYPLFVREIDEFCFSLRLLQANLSGSLLLFLSPRPALTFCFRIALKYSRLNSRNDVSVKGWFGVAYLDEVCSFCSSMRLYGTNFAQVLPFSKSSRIVSPFLSRFTCSWFSINFCVIQPSVALCNCSCSVYIRRFAPSFFHPQSRPMRWSIICTTSLKPFVCLRSCFPEFETKL